MLKQLDFHPKSSPNASLGENEILNEVAPYQLVNVPFDPLPHTFYLPNTNAMPLSMLSNYAYAHAQQLENEQTAVVRDAAP
jgi:hypothetical protein